MPLVELALAQLSGVQVGKPARGVYAFVEAGGVRDAEGGLVVVTRIAAAAPDVSLVESAGLRLALARGVRLAADAARRRRRLRRRRRALGAP